MVNQYDGLRDQIALSLIDGNVGHDSVIEIGPGVYFVQGIVDIDDAIEVLKGLWPKWKYSTRDAGKGCLIVNAWSFEDQITQALALSMDRPKIEAALDEDAFILSGLVNWGSALSILRRSKPHWIVDPWGPDSIMVSCYGTVIR